VDTDQPLWENIFAFRLEAIANAYPNANNDKTNKDKTALKLACIKILREIKEMFSTLLGNCADNVYGQVAEGSEGNQANTPLKSALMKAIPVLGGTCDFTEVDAVTGECAKTGQRLR
jgi:hypothetical protein